jgi:hypothetical protein
MTDQPDQTQPQYTEIIAPAAAPPTPPPPAPSAFPFTSTAQPPAALETSDSAPKPIPAPTSEMASEVVVLLKDAKERLAVNAISDVGYFIGRAITLLGGKEDEGS